MSEEYDDYGLNSMENDTFEEEMPQDLETGVYTMVVEKGHWLFKECQNPNCKHVQGRHSNFPDWNSACFDCPCKAFIPQSEK